MKDWRNYLEENYDGKNISEQQSQVLEDISQAEEIAKGIEELFREYEESEYKKRYLLNGAILTCNQATLDPFILEDGTEIKLAFRKNETSKVQKNMRKTTKLLVHKEDTNMSSMNELHATILDCERGKNIFPFRCNCKLAADREEEKKKIKECLEGIGKNVKGEKSGSLDRYDKESKKAQLELGVCRHLMRLNNVWENFPEEHERFYDKRTVKRKFTKESGEEVEFSVEAPCISMTSMLFCKHGGLITPVKSGQPDVYAEPVVTEQLYKITGVSERYIPFLKSYETGKDRDGNLLPIGQPALYPYHVDKDPDNVLTIGWGHAIENEEQGWYEFDDKQEINLYIMIDRAGEEVKSITMSQAEEILVRDIREREKTLNNVLMEKGIEYEVTQAFYDALFDLVYQVGENILTKENGDLSTFLEEGNFDINNDREIKEQFGDYTGGGEPYMKLRRADELDFIFRDDYERNDDENDVGRYGDIWQKK